MAVELALESGSPSGRVSVEHVINVLARLNAAPRPDNVAAVLQVLTPLIADTARYDRLRDLQGMAATWADLIEQNNAELDRSRWLVEQMLRAETTERATRSREPPDERGEVSCAQGLCGVRVRGLLGGPQAGAATGHDGLYRRGAQRRARWWAWQR